MRVNVTDKYVQEYEEMLRNASGYTPFFKNYLRPLTLVGNAYFPAESDLDVAAFRVEQIHPNASVVKLGIHYDDWIDRNVGIFPTQSSLDIHQFPW